MVETVLNWASDRLASSDIIDLYFVVSDLIDIPLSDDELYETAYYDAFSSQTAESPKSFKDQNIPIGKLVL